MGPWITTLPRPPNERCHTRTQQSQTTASASPTSVPLCSTGRTPSPRTRQSGPRLLAMIYHPPLASQRACMPVSSRRSRDEGVERSPGDATWKQIPVSAGCAGGNGSYPSPAPRTRPRDLLIAATRQAIPRAVPVHLAHPSSALTSSRPLLSSCLNLKLTSTASSSLPSWRWLCC